MIKNKHNLFRLILIILLISGCAHYNEKPDLKALKSYNQSIQNLNLGSSFAFAIDGHDYYFISSQTAGYLNDCNRFDGYKDDQLTYSFSSKQLFQLYNLYKSNLEINLKIKEILKQIENFTPRFYVCEPKLPPQNDSVPIQILEKGLNFIIYGTIGIVALPIAVPAMISDSIAERDLHKKLEQIRLGASLDQINKIMKSDFIEEVSSEYVIQKFDFVKSFHSHRRLVFVYKNKKVIAYVWGLVP